MQTRILLGALLGLAFDLEARQMMCGGGSLSGNSGILYYHAGTDAQGHDLWKIARDANGTALTCSNPGTKFNAMVASGGNRPSAGVLADRLTLTASGRPSGARPTIANLKETVTSRAGVGELAPPLFLEERVYNQLFTLLERDRKAACRPPNHWNGSACVDTANPQSSRRPRVN